MWRIWRSRWIERVSETDGIWEWISERFSDMPEEGLGIIRAEPTAGDGKEEKNTNKISKKRKE